MTYLKEKNQRNEQNTKANIVRYEYDNKPKMPIIFKIMIVIIILTVFVAVYYYSPMNENMTKYITELKAKRVFKKARKCEDIGYLKVKKGIGENADNIEIKTGTNFFGGNVYKIPIIQKYEINAYTLDTVGTQYEITGKIRDDIPYKKLYDYYIKKNNPIEHKLHMILAENTAKYNVAEILHSKNLFLNAFKYDIVKMLNSEGVDLLQIYISFDDRFTKELEKKQQIIEHEKEIALAKAQQQEIEDKVRINNAMLERAKHDSLLTKRIVDSMRIEIQKAITEQLNGKLPNN